MCDCELLPHGRSAVATKVLQGLQVRASTAAPVAGAGGVATLVMDHPLPWDAGCLFVSYTPGTATMDPNQVGIRFSRLAWANGGPVGAPIPIGDPNSTLGDIICGNATAPAGGYCIRFCLDGGAVGPSHLERLQVTITNNNTAVADTVSLAFRGRWRDPCDESPMPPSTACGVIAG